MSQVSQDQVVEFLSNMPVIELAGLIKTLEDKWGVKAAAPVAVAAAPAAAAAPVEAQTEFNVELADGGANKIAVIKVVRELTGLGLEEAKYAVDANNTPYDESVLYAYPPGARALWLSSDQVASLKEVDPGLILTCVP